MTEIWRYLENATAYTLKLAERTSVLAYVFLLIFANISWGKKAPVEAEF